MKKQGKGSTDSVPFASSTGSLSVQVDHDHQMVAFKPCSGNGYATGNGSRDKVISRVGKMPDALSCSQDHLCGLKDEGVPRNSVWMLDSGSQAYSGPEDNSTDPHDTLTESSTLTFVDAHTTDESAENHSLQGAGVVYFKEFVLIDDDDDGDMSLREKTVTDLSNTDGKAAELVCGRLLSTSSGTASESKEEHEASPPKEVEAAHKDSRCCFCTLL